MCVCSLPRKQYGGLAALQHWRRTRSLTAVAPRGSTAPGAARHGPPGAPKARGPTAGRHRDHPPSLWGQRPGLAGAVPSAFVQRPRQQATLLLPPRSAAPTPLPGCPLTSTPRLHQTRTRRNPDLPNRAIRAGRWTSRRHELQGKKRTRLNTSMHVPHLSQAPTLQQARRSIVIMATGST